MSSATKAAHCRVGAMIVRRCVPPLSLHQENPLSRSPEVGVVRSAACDDVLISAPFGSIFALAGWHLFRCGRSHKDGGSSASQDWTTRHCFGSINVL